MSKQYIIQQFVLLYDKLPHQGTIEWLANRSERFGGSELATLLNIDKYKTLLYLIKEKLGLISQEETLQRLIFLNWGNNFEIVHQLILEQLFNTFIYELKSIPWHNNICFDYQDLTNINYGLLNSSYVHISPDGLALINKSHIISLINNKSNFIKVYMPESFNLDNYDDEIFVMFEQKAPYSRNIMPSIPDYYVPQVMSGMCVIPFVNFAIYTEAVFRFAHVDNVLNKIYKTYKMPINQKDLNNVKPYKRGLIGYYVRLGTNKTTEIINRFKTDNNDLDLLKLDIIEVFELFKLVKLRKYVDVDIINLDDSDIACNKVLCKNDTRNKDNTYYFLGFIGWYLYDVTFHFVEPDKNYLYKHYEYIKSVGDFIKKNKCINDESIIEDNYNTFMNELSI